MQRMLRTFKLKGELVTGSRIDFLERGLRVVCPCILATDGHVAAIVQG